MGKVSKLRNPQLSQSRYEYSNGQRKLYDRDKMPEGLDSDVWDLVLLFEQLAEENKAVTPGRPIIYSELYHRISKDPVLRELLPSHDTQVYTRARVTTGIYTTEVIITLLQQMIRYYWDHYYHISSNKQQPVNDFTSIVVFDYIKQYIADSNERKQLITTGKRVTQHGSAVKPSRRTDKQRAIYHTISRNYTEKELENKIADWKRDS